MLSSYFLSFRFEKKHLDEVMFGWISKRDEVRDIEKALEGFLLQFKKPFLTNAFFQKRTVTKRVFKSFNGKYRFLIDMRLYSPKVKILETILQKF